MRLFFLNRADVIVIEDGCVVTGSSSQAGDAHFWQRSESEDRTRYTWKAPAPASGDECMDKPFPWAADGDATGLLHKYGQHPTDYICTLAFPNAPTAPGMRLEFKTPNDCALAVKHGVLSSPKKTVDKCVCRVLMKEKFGGEWCPGTVCHSMPQSHYSKDFHAGDDFMIRYCHLTDVAKCWRGLQTLVEEMHGGDELPLLKMRMRPANPEIARVRCLSSTTPAPLPKSDATSVSEATFVANSIEGPSVERLYSEWIDSFEDKMSARGHSFGARLSERWSPLILSLTSRPIADESGWYRVCTLCPGRKRVNSDHFLHDLEHCKRL